MTASLFEMLIVPDVLRFVLENKPRVRPATVARGKRFPVHHGDIMLLGVLRIMHHAINPRLGTVVPGFEHVSFVGRHVPFLVRNEGQSLRDSRQIGNFSSTYRYLFGETQEC